MTGNLLIGFRREEYFAFMCICVYRGRRLPKLQAILCLSLCSAHEHDNDKRETEEVNPEKRK